MTRWPRGEAEIEQLIQKGQLQRVVGGQANGAHLIEKATRTPAEAAAAIQDTRRLLEAATALVQQLSLF